MLQNGETIGEPSRQTLADMFSLKDRTVMITGKEALSKMCSHASNVRVFESNLL